jgi:effector-binding domain-containing protein
VKIMLTQHTITAPRIVDRPPERMAVVETVGDPDEVATRAVGSLYGAIAQLGLKSGPLRARWPNASDHPKEEWVARWALPVPAHTPELGGGISLETWYGHPVAEILHKGPFGEAEVQEVKRLQRFIFDCGYEVAGDAEEEYLTRPDEEPQRTIVRYEIRQTHQR